MSAAEAVGCGGLAGGLYLVAVGLWEQSKGVFEGLSVQFTSVIVYSNSLLRTGFSWFAEGEGLISLR